MPQTKKKEIREAILVAAYRLFKKKGYLHCRMTEIARAADTSVSNIYVYFPSKMHLFYEVNTPLITARMIRLGNDARLIADSRKRLRFIFLTLWRDIPTEDNGFLYNLMQAIVTAPRSVEKPHHPLNWLEETTNNLIKQCLPEHRQFLVKDSMISFLAWMAFDGFVVNVVRGEERDIDTIVDHFADMLLGESGGEKGRAGN